MNLSEPPPRRISESIFGTFADLLWKAVSRPGRVLVLSLLLTAVCGYFAAGLRVDADLVNLLPPDHPNVRALTDLRERVGGEAVAAVIVECPETEAMKQFADVFIPRIEALRQSGGEPYLTHVEYRRDVDFLKRNALYLATDAELETIEDYLYEAIEKARIAVNPMLVDLLEEDEEEGESETEKEIERIRGELLSREYPLSDDGRTMVLKLFVTGSKTDLGFIDSLYETLEKEIESVGPASFHREMKVELGGPLLRHSMELHAIGRDVAGSVGTGILLVLAVVAAYFFSRAYRIRAAATPRLEVILSELVRTPLAAVVIGLPLGMSLSWTFCIAYFRFGTLNLMTSTLALVLFGLGIDFSIHIYARYTEGRGDGLGVHEAMERSVRANVQPITITSATTATSFGILSFANFRGFSEFGFIAAVGLVFAMLAMLTVLPALVIFLETNGLLNLKTAADRRPGKGRARRFPFAAAVTFLCLAFLAAAMVTAPRIGFEWNFDTLEPDFPEYGRLKEKYNRVYPPRGRNPAFIVADTQEEVPAIVAAVREKAVGDIDTPTVKKVESLQERFPLDPGEQKKKLEQIATISRLLENRHLRRSDSEELDLLRDASQITEPVPLESLPRSLRMTFTAKDGSVGNFVMVYPSVGLSDGRNSMAFADDVGTVVTAEGRVYHAASTSIIAAEMLRLMRAESPVMISLSALSLLILVPLAFRRGSLSVLALTPLAVGIAWMLALTVLWRMNLNFYNMVVFPTVLGMGADAGVHLVHRWTLEGRGAVLEVLRSTGEAVAICTVTTMVGFSGMTTSFHPGLRSMGWLAVIGLGCTLAASLLLLPAVMQLIDDRRRQVRRR